jgi:hypothetical protein
VKFCRTRGFRDVSSAKCQTRVGLDAIGDMPEFEECPRLRFTSRAAISWFLGAAAQRSMTTDTDFLERFRTPVSAAKVERRWLTGLYLDVPEEWDDPYRFFRW